MTVQAEVTIIVATHNAARTVQDCIDSVSEQVMRAVELVVVDGASTDGTVELLARNQEAIAWWVSEPDDGIYHAWNKALSHARGEWFLFLGADDGLASPDVLRRMAPHLAGAAGRYRVVYGSLDLLDERGEVSGSLGRPWTEAGPRFPVEMSIPHPATFHHRSLFDLHGSFDQSYRIGGDYEFLLRELLDHDALFVPDVTVTRMGSGGLSDNPRTMATLVRETHRARYAHGLVDTPDWRSFEVLRATTHARLTQAFGRRTADAVGDLYRAVTRTKKRRPGP